MTPGNAKQKVLSAIDARLPEFVKLLGDVVRIPTDNPPGDTRACAAFLAAHLKALGLPSDLYEPAPTFQSLVSYIEGARSGRNLVLNGHLDQFPAGNAADWSGDPYAGECRDGRIVGRGVGDMKAGSVISLLCLQLMHELAIPIDGQLTLTLVADEETGGHLGAEWLLDNVPITRGDASLNSEPTGFDQILVGHKGKYVLAVETSHAGGMATVPAPDDAIAQAMKIAQAVRQLQGWKKEPPADVAAAVARGKARLLEDEDSREDAWVVDATTVNVGTIRGGIQHNTVPTRCKMEIDMRPPLGIDGAQMKARVAEVMAAAGVGADDFSGEWTVELPPAYCSPDTDLVRVLRDNVHQITGLEPEVNISAGSTDARFWWLRDIPAAIYGTSCFNIAVPDEYVLEREFEQALKVHALTVIDYLDV